MEECAWDRAVEQAKGRELAREVEALTLDGVVKCAQGKLPKTEIFTPFTQLKRLSIANVGLASLVDFASLTLLERLMLSDNRIAGGLEHFVYAGLKLLWELDLSNKKIQAVDDLKPLAQLKLESPDLYECPVTRSTDYRAKVFDMMKTLRFLDKTDLAGNERPESDDEESEDDLNGGGMEVVGEEVGGGSKVSVAHDGNDEEGDEDEEGDDEGNGNEEFGDEKEDVGGSYQEVVMPSASVRGSVLGQVNFEYGSDEEVEADDDNLEVQDVDEAGAEDVGGEDDEDAAVEEEEELASDAHVSAEGELDVYERDDEEVKKNDLGEGDEDDDAVDDECEEEVEDEDDEEEEGYGTRYLLQPIGQPEEEEGTSDFEPGNEVEEDEDFDDEQDGYPVKEPLEVTLNRKRYREETSEKEDRSAKH